MLQFLIILWLSCGFLGLIVHANREDRTTAEDIIVILLLGPGALIGMMVEDIIDFLFFNRMK